MGMIELLLAKVVIRINEVIQSASEYVIHGKKEKES